MSYSVRQIRQQIAFHREARDCPMSEDGYPSSVQSQWFPRGQMPKDPWTYRALNVQIVNGPKTATAPNNISFNIKPDGSAAGHTAWYNRANGSFCVMVPKKGSTADQQELFDQINGFQG